MSHNSLDIGGQRFGLWTVLSRNGSTSYGKTLWRCKCDCGTIANVVGQSLSNGSSTNCGCTVGRRAGRRKKHGMCGTTEYRSWTSMKDRCQNPNTPHWNRYGGRGITVCERWQTFDNFLADMGPKPSMKHTIERMDTNGNYEPSNCRWATRYEQAHNRSSNRNLTYDGKTMTVSEWAQHLAIPEDLIRGRLKLKWPVGKALTQAARPQRGGGERNESGQFTRSY